MYRYFGILTLSPKPQTLNPGKAAELALEAEAMMLGPSLQFRKAVPTRVL